MLITGGDTPTLTIDGVMPGATTTEDWRVIWSDREQSWLVTGSQSGQQENRLTAGQSYTSDREEIRLSVEGTATDGDLFTFSTDTQIQEVDLGGMPLSMLALDEVHLLISIWDANSSSSSLLLYNKREQVEVGRWMAPENAQLGNMTLLDSGTEVWITDQQNDRLFALEVQLDDIAESLYLEIPTLGPITDISTLSTETYTHVYVASDQRIDVWDVNAEKWKHINPLDPYRGGVDLNSPIVGLSSSQEQLIYRPPAHGSHPNKTMWLSLLCSMVQLS